jgi:hypothetical protein
MQRCSTCVPFTSYRSRRWKNSAKRWDLSSTQQLNSIFPTMYAVCWWCVAFDERLTACSRSNQRLTLWFFFFPLWQFACKNEAADFKRLGGVLRDPPPLALKLNNARKVANQLHEAAKSLGMSVSECGKYARADFREVTQAHLRVVLQRRKDAGLGHDLESWPLVAQLCFDNTKASTLHCARTACGHCTIVHFLVR